MKDLIRVFKKCVGLNNVGIWAEAIYSNGNLKVSIRNDIICDNYAEDVDFNEVLTHLEAYSETYSDSIPEYVVKCLDIPLCSVEYVDFRFKIHLDVKVEINPFKVYSNIDGAIL